MAPYAQWGLHAGTPLHETGDEFAFGLAPNRDVFAIKQRNTGSRSTEVHVLSAESSYQQFALQTGTVLHETGDEFAFLVADNRDLVAVKKRNTGSRSTEVHVVSASDNYQQFSVQTATALHETGDEFAFAWAANRDLVAIKKRNTGSGSTEVHILSAASNYQQFAVQTGTPLHETGDEFAFVLADNRDLVVVKKRNTGTSSTEVHILSAASNYQQFVLQTGTSLHEAGDEFAFLLAPNADLFAVKKRNTGTRSTEIHVLLRVEETQSRDVAGECVLLPAELALSAVHAALLRTGRLLFFSYDPPQENNTSVGKWVLWDPATGPVTPVARDIGRNLFCAGHCFLADGRLLVAGGQSNNVPPFTGQGADHDIHIFDPVAESWTRLENMPAARYYPTCVTLPGGNGLIASGAANRYIPTFQNVPNDDYEVFDWRRNVRTSPARFNPGHMVELYPFIHVIPDGSPQGRLLVFSKNEARLFSLDTGTWDPTRFRTQSPGSRTYPHQGACVLLPILPEEPNRIRVMVIGGEGVDHSATNTAEIFDFDSARPTAGSWRDPAGGHMRHGRFMADAVLLPDATLLVVNGAGGGAADHSHDPVLQAELFDPATETWRPMASINRQRMYHSTAILLPTAEVLIGGNTEHWNPANPVEDKTLELFRPPYLFRGARPKISQAPQAIAYGESFDIITPQPSVGRVALLRCGSVTHTNNMDQRYVGLSIQRRETDRLTVLAPPNGTVAPPGFYLLFIVTGEGIPSIGHMVHLDPTRVALAQPLIIDRWFTVNESDASVDTGIDAVPTDLIAFEASGDIWAGVWATDRNGPNGWNNVDHDPKFPLHRGADAHPFALIGRYGDADYFFIGARRDRAASPIAQPSRLFLRTNDDRPGNGDGAFNCRVQVWRRASSDFDVEFYVTQHGDLASAFAANYTAAFDHWINQGLPNEGRRGSIEFDVRFYLERYGDLRNAFSTDYQAALDHWVRQGLPNEGRRGSVEFDVQFYLNQYGDLRNAFGTDYRAAAEHWWQQGLPVEGRRGSREFDVQFYLKRYADLRAAFGTRYRAALDHWLRQGLPNEGRRGSREFDVQFYLSKYSDLRAAFGSDYRAAMSHWVNQGCRNEGRAGAREIDVSYYLTNYGDLAAAFGANREAALDHWIMQGLPHEGRRASLDFDVQYYLATYTDLQAAFGHDYRLAFDHWVIAGISEGRNGAP